MHPRRPLCVGSGIGQLQRPVGRFLLAALPHLALSDGRPFDIGYFELQNVPGVGRRHEWLGGSEAVVVSIPTVDQQLHRACAAASGIRGLDGELVPLGDHAHGGDLAANLGFCRHHFRLNGVVVQVSRAKPGSALGA